MKSYPSQIPIFPLSGVIYFPKTNLPLNIFEKRYLDLVNDSIKKDKLMGMIQSKKKGEDLYRVGCLGKISEFKRSEDFYGKVISAFVGEEVRSASELLNLKAPKHDLFLKK